MAKDEATALSRELACSLGQHEWVVDQDDIRFRMCIHCDTTQYNGKEVKRAKRSNPKNIKDK